MKQRGVVGAPFVFVIVDAKGCPERALTLTSSGETDMDRAALQLAVDGTYFPAESDGAPIRSGLSFPVKFELK